MAVLHLTTNASVLAAACRIVRRWSGHCSRGERGVEPRFFRAIFRPPQLPPQLPPPLWRCRSLQMPPVLLRGMDREATGRDEPGLTVATDALAPDDSDPG